MHQDLGTPWPILAQRVSEQCFQHLPATEGLQDGQLVTEDWNGKPRLCRALCSLIASCKDHGKLVELRRTLPGLIDLWCGSIVSGWS